MRPEEEKEEVEREEVVREERGIETADKEDAGTTRTVDIDDCVKDEEGRTEKEDNEEGGEKEEPGDDLETNLKKKFS